jgi:pleckstrin family protein A (phosphoinositide binding specific) protein 8
LSQPEFKAALDELGSRFEYSKDLKGQMFKASGLERPDGQGIIYHKEFTPVCVNLFLSSIEADEACPNKVDVPQAASGKSYVAPAAQPEEPEAVPAEVKVVVVAKTPADFGKTFFAKLSCSWANIETMPSTNPLDMELNSFVEACATLSTVYDKLGSMLSAAKKDMNDNLATIRKGAADKPQIRTIQDAVRFDINNKLCFRDNKNRKGVSFGILWLVRALRFIVIFLGNLTADTFAGKEMGKCSSDAYGKTIKPYHGWMLSGVFGTMMGQVPSRKTFLKNTCQGESDEVTYNEIKGLVAVAGPLVDALHQFYVQQDLNDPWKA